MKSLDHKTRATLLAIVVLAMIMLAMIAKWSKKPRSTASHRPCVANLKMIDGAKEEWAVKFKKSTNATPIWSDLIGTNRFLATFPKCPNGGNYEVGRMNQYPTCSIGGPEHSLPLP